MNFLSLNTKHINNYSLKNKQNRNKRILRNVYENRPNKSEFMNISVI